ncbi:hypothetical protein [Streptomyces hokutonensis]|uniref:hypothetical protein n=1 Tax=Streptomyces hokutonensis TaxID=1306990 RepID=UPI003803E781
MIQSILTFNGPSDNDIQVWFEPCNTSGAALGDVVVPATFPGISSVSAAQPIISAPPTPPAPVPWYFENLDGDQGSVGGHNYDLGQSPAAVEYNSTLQTFYNDASNGYLRHAWSDSSGWHSEVLDGAGGANGRLTANLGGTPTVTVYNNTLQVFYYDVTHHGLRHAWSDSTGWHFESLDGSDSTIAGHYSSDVGKTPNVVATPDGRLQVVYYDQTNGNLRHAYSDATGWHFENLDGDPGSLGHLDSNLGTDPTSAVFNGRLHLFYRDIGNGNLRHAWDDPTTGWHFETLDGDAGSTAGLNADTGSTPTAVVYGSTLQLFYYDNTNGNLRHAWDDGTVGWHFENLEGDSGSVSNYVSTVGLMPTATVLNGNLQVFYYEAQDGGRLRHAFNDATGWHFENLDGLGGQTGRYIANEGLDPVAIPYGGHVQLLYYDGTNGNLRHVWSQ